MPLWIVNCSWSGFPCNWRYINARCNLLVLPGQMYCGISSCTYISDMVDLSGVFRMRERGGRGSGGNWYQFQKSTLGTGEKASPSVCGCVCVCMSVVTGRWHLMTCYSCYTVLPTHPLLSFTPRSAPTVTTATFPTRTQGFWVLRVGFQTLYCAKKNYGPAKGGGRPSPNGPP